MRTRRRTRAIARCSFCGNDERSASKLIAGPPGIHICGSCVALCNDVLAGDATPAFAQAESLGDEELLATLRSTSDAASAMRDMLGARVALLRHAESRGCRSGRRSE